jgi:proton glutamate symport protein
VFLLLYLFVAVLTTLLSPLLFAWLSVPPDTIAFLKQSLGGGSVESAVTKPSVGEQVVRIIPANPFKAAVEGEVLPLVIFSILFGLAVTRIAPETRQVLVRFFQGVADAMLVIVRWILIVPGWSIRSRTSTSSPARIRDCPGAGVLRRPLVRALCCLHIRALPAG